MNTLPGETIAGGAICVGSALSLLLWSWLTLRPKRPASLWPMLAMSAGVTIAVSGVFFASLWRWLHEGTIDPETAFKARSWINGGGAMAVAFSLYYFWRRR